MGLPSAKQIEHFWERVFQPSPNECWEWRGSLAKKRGGYGTLTWRGRSRKAHQVAYELTHGPTDLHVLHSCDNPPCCNPAHLFAGTDLDNVQDMDQKGRRRVVIPKGVDHHSCKLTPAQVVDIRTDPRSGRVLAPEYGVNRTTIDRIRRREIWKDVQ